MKKQYEHNKLAKVGETIICPICGKTFVKKQYSQAFCSLSCKDKFHNKIKSKPKNKKVFGIGICKHCGKKFTKHHPNQKFCSISHKDKYHNRINPRGYGLFSSDYNTDNLTYDGEEFDYFSDRGI